MNKNKQVPRVRSATASAIEEIRKLIFSGELRSGSNHFESELAERLGMSRTPIREAALILAGQGLLEVQPRKGVRVVSISLEDMKEIYAVLTELESLAAGLAAQCKYTKTELRVLAQAIEKMNVALKSDDRESWASADEHFHAELVRLGKNTRVIDIVSNFNDQVRRARLQTLHLRPAPVQSNIDHQALYDAILAGEVAKAQRIHRMHRKQASTMLTTLLEEAKIVQL